MTENMKAQIGDTVDVVMSQKEAKNLLIDGFVFQRCNKVVNDDGSTAWRCQNSRKIDKCKSTCCIDSLNRLLRVPSPHNHDPPTTQKLLGNEVKYRIKKRCRSDHIPVQKVAKEETAKALEEFKIKLTPKYAKELPVKKFQIFF